MACFAFLCVLDVRINCLHTAQSSLMRAVVPLQIILPLMTATVLQDSSNLFSF